MNVTTDCGRLCQIKIIPHNNIPTCNKNVKRHINVMYSFQLVQFEMDNT